MEVNETKSAWQMGFSARRRGDSIHQNPFVLFTSAHSEWQQGWYDQDDHMNAKEESLNSIGWNGPTPCK